MQLKVDKKRLKERLAKLYFDHYAISFIGIIVSTLVLATRFAFEMGFGGATLRFSTYEIAKLSLFVTFIFLVIGLVEQTAYYVVRHLIKKEERS